MKYLHRILCCVESVETRPPFLWVSCQSRKIVLRARTSPLWYFTFPCYTELGEGRGNGFTPIMLHCDLCCPQFITIFLLPLILSHLFKLGRKKTQQNNKTKPRRRKEKGELGISFQLRREPVSAVCCWWFQAFHGHFQIPLSADSQKIPSIPSKVRAPPWIVIHFALSSCNEFYTPPHTKIPLK